jgi:hypothetical protein
MILKKEENKIKQRNTVKNEDGKESQKINESN